MVGGGKKRDDGSLAINSTNVFAALDSLRRKKKSDKEHGPSKSKVPSKSQVKEPEPQVFWASGSLSGKSWADVDDEDDDDYYATTAPPTTAWASSDSQQDKRSSTILEEIESEDDGLDEVDDDVDVDEEQDQEPEAPLVTESVANKSSHSSLAPKESEKQLSKKELKKKELAELDAVLAELGMNSNGQDQPNDAVQEKKPELNGDEEKKETETKTARKKKAKKDKSSKDAKEAFDQQNGSDAPAAEEANPSVGSLGEKPAVDVKERLKKVSTLKKKKSGKEMDAAAKAAAVEAAARSAKLAAAKKKEKNHYNQQPVR